MSTNQGKQFEADFRDSCKKEDVFFYRIKDIYVPPHIQHLVQVSQNLFDCFMYSTPNLFSLEMKSINGTSMSYKSNMIKPHQIDNLLECSRYKGMISGFLFNFRGKSNRVFFIHIEEFLKYRDIAEGVGKSPYKNKINKSSIPIAICEEIGIEITSQLKRVRYKYSINEFVGKAIERYGNDKTTSYSHEEFEKLCKSYRLYLRSSMQVINDLLSNKKLTKEAMVKQILGIMEGYNDIAAPKDKIGV